MKDRVEWKIMSDLDRVVKKWRGEISHAFDQWRLDARLKSIRNSRSLPAARAEYRTNEENLQKRTYALMISDPDRLKESRKAVKDILKTATGWSGLAKAEEDVSRLSADFQKQLDADLAGFKAELEVARGRVIAAAKVPSRIAVSETPDKPAPKVAPAGSPADKSAKDGADEKEPAYRGKSVQEWIGELNDSYPQVRLEAVQALGAIGPKAKKAAGPLIDVLKQEKNRAVWLAAVTALGRIGKDAIPDLREVLKSDNREVCYRAVRALGLIGKDAVPTLSEALQSKYSEVRQASLYALGTLGPSAKGAVPQLIQLMKNSAGRGSELQDVVRALGEIGPDAKEAVPSIIEAMQVERNRSGNPWRFADALALMGEDGVIAVAAGLKHNDVLVRRAASRALRRMGPAGKKAVPALTDALTDPDPRVRRDSVEALGQIGPDAKAAVPALINAMKDEKSIRRLAVTALGQIGPDAKSAVDPLLKALTDPKVGQLAATALKAIDPEAAKRAGRPITPARK
jgi:HEAT repeat protein